MSLLQVVSALVMSCLVVYIILREIAYRKTLDELCDIIADQKNKVNISVAIAREQKLEISRNLDQISKYELRIDELTAQTLAQNAKIVELNGALNIMRGVSEELENEIRRLRAEDDRKTALLAKFNQK